MSILSDPQLSSFHNYLDERPNLKNHISRLSELDAAAIAQELGFDISVSGLMRYRATKLLTLSEEEVESLVADLLWAKTGAAKAQWDGLVLVGGRRNSL